MQAVGAVVGGQLVGLAVEGELRASNAVCDAADERAKVGRRAVLRCRVGKVLGQARFSAAQGKVQQGPAPRVIPLGARLVRLLVIKAQHHVRQVAGLSRRGQ